MRFDRHSLKQARIIHTKKERDHIVGMASVKGYIPEVIEKVDEMADAAEKKTIEEMATDAKNSMSIGTPRFAAGAIIFEAIKAASKVRVHSIKLYMVHIMALIALSCLNRLHNVTNHEPQDGLDDKEMEAIRCIADIMGVTKEKVDVMAELVAEEEALKKKRIAACLPDHPCLAPEYKK